MTDFYNNNSNQDGSRNDNNLNSQNQYNKVPEYSFWAEQRPDNSYQYNNQSQNQNNTWQDSNPAPNKNQYNNTQRPSGRKKSGGKAAKFIAKAVCFGIIAAISFIGFEKAVNIMFPNSGAAGIISAINEAKSNKHYEVKYTNTGTVKTEDKSVITKIADSTLPSIVSINCSSNQTAQDWFGQQYNQDVSSSGSGIIVGKNDKELLIATNNHVIEGSNKTIVTFKDGKQAEATLKGTDSTADLAVVTIDISKLSADTLKAIAVAKLGDSDAIQVGQMSIAIGNALGYGQSVTVGYISAKNREVDVSDNYNTKKMTFLQTDAAINPGNSGGALININGEVIGINTVKYASNEVEGMGYAIPISKASPIINDLMNREILSENEKGYLGISGYDVTEEASKYYNIPIGVYINEVVQGGAAYKAGLKVSDVIVKVNNIEVTSMTQLKEYVNSLKVGTKIDITYMRNSDGNKYKKSQVTVTLGKNPQLTN